LIFCGFSIRLVIENNEFTRVQEFSAPPRVEWSNGLGGKGEDRRTFIIRSVINNNHFTTDPIYFWYQARTTPNMVGVVVDDSNGCKRIHNLVASFISLDFVGYDYFHQ
jgi:hypothetical protein